jgi:hypothetical protein
MEKQFNRVSPDCIDRLDDNEIFVFGSNLAGAHGGGAAALAYSKFKAEWGVGVGRTGRCYAIPTMHGGVAEIKPFVDQFIDYARKNPDLKFLVTRVGCGIAGFTDEEIAPLFKACVPMVNVYLPLNFWKVI